MTLSISWAAGEMLTLDGFWPRSHESILRPHARRSRPQLSCVPSVRDMMAQLQILGVDLKTFFFLAWFTLPILTF